MKLLYPPLVLLLLGSATREEVALRFEPEEGTSLVRVFEAHAEYELSDQTASFDDEALETDGLPDSSMEFDEHIAVTDELRAVEDGRATELVRTFDELSQRDAQRFEDEEVEAELGSDLEGRSVVFRWDEDEEAYGVSAADDEDLDEGLAAWLAEDMDLRLVLPDHEVEPGDEWELDARLYLAFMWPGGLLDFRTEDDEPTDEDRDPSRQTIGNLEGSGTATLEEIREEDGVRVAVIHVQLEIETGSSSTYPGQEPDEEHPGFPPREVEVEIERSLEGTILWDLEHGHALSAELECESSRLVTTSVTLHGTYEGEEVEADYEESSLWEGTITYKATIERR